MNLPVNLIRIDEEAEEAHAGEGGDEAVGAGLEGFFQHGGQVAHRAKLKVVAHAAKHIGARLGAHSHKCQADDAHMNQGIFHIGRVFQHPFAKQQTELEEEDGNEFGGNHT